MPPDLLLLVAMVAMAGAVAGLLAGLLGVGGGIVIVPVLEYALGAAGVPVELRMHLAVGTSLASIIPTALASARAHRLRGAFDGEIARQWAPAIALGAVLGAVVAAAASGAVLRAVFGGVALLIAARMLLRNQQEPVAHVMPVRGRWRLVPGGIGLVSAMMGIGGGSLSVPVLSAFGMPVHRAVGTSAWLGLWIALPAACGFVMLGYGRAGLPAGSVGFVNLPALAVLLPMTILLAPAGAALAHRLSRPVLSSAFGVFLLLVSLRMLYRSLA